MPAQQINDVTVNWSVPLIQFNNKFTKVFVDGALFKIRKRKSNSPP